HQSENFSIITAVENLAATLKLIYPDKLLTFDINVNPQSHFPGEQSDFNELMGNLMDNAAKWSDGMISVDINGGLDQFEVIVNDNGPGCSKSKIERLTKRGIRLDEQAKGHGLGLNIVLTIVEQYQGDILFTNREPKGLSVRIQLPSSLI
ncbi:MAG: ATP-binding protein, partial [Neptuniibacter sp.]